MKLTSFRIIILIIFGAFGVIGMIVFAFFGGVIGGGTTHPVLIWGTMEEEVMNDVLTQFRDDLKDFSVTTYVEKDPRTFEREFVEALAIGVGPDLILLPQDFILEHQNKLIVLPYESYSERSFKDAFVEEGELFLVPGGVLGFPFSIDPLVMYWNRNIFSSAGLAKPPAFWDELFVITPDLVEYDQAQNVLKSAVALGEYRNIDHAKEIVSALIIQAGSSITSRVDREVRSTLGVRGDFPSPPAEAALLFYTEFSNPVKTVYSWNRALPSSREAFVAGDLAIYFGFASELPELRGANPNLNFDVAPLPQTRDMPTRTTFGVMQALAVTRIARDQNTAFQVASFFASEPVVAFLAQNTTLPPVRRDVVSRKPLDAYKVVFYNSAIMARAWLDPDTETTDVIFKNMVEGITSGRVRLREAVQTADAELNSLF